MFQWPCFAGKGIHSHKTYISLVPRCIKDPLQNTLAKIKFVCLFASLSYAVLVVILCYFVVLDLAGPLLSCCFLLFLLLLQGHLKLSFPGALPLALAGVGGYYF